MTSTPPRRIIPRVEFRVNGRRVAATRIRAGETREAAARRIGVHVGQRLSADGSRHYAMRYEEGSVFGDRGEVRFFGEEASK